MNKLALTCLLLTLTLIDVQGQVTRVELPKPTGPYKIGHIQTELSDSSRTMKPGPTKGPRRLSLHVYFPADENLAQIPNQYLSDPQATYLISDERQAAYRLPASLGKTWGRQVLTHSFNQVPISTARTSWPLIIYTHGLNSLVELGQSFIEDLASHGFVVVCFEMPNISGATYFSDGTLLTATPVPSSTFWWDFYVSQYDDILLDCDFILSSLVTSKGKVLGDSFDSKIDFTKVGAFGHSFGGSTAINFATRNPLVSSAINLDGSIVNPPGAPVHRPALLSILSEGHFSSPDTSIKNPSKTYDGLYSWLEIMGAQHENFGDIPYLLKQFGLNHNYPQTGPVEPQRLITIIRLAILGHFTQTLGVSETKSYADTIKKSLNPYAEAKFFVK